MKTTLLVATHNQGKVRELAELLADKPARCLTLDAAGVRNDVAETGTTLAENAILKACTYARQTGYLTLADDTGLEVDALGGAPGVHTARFGGPGLDARERYQLLLEKLADVPDQERTARFRCVIALAGPEGRLLGTAEGVCEGAIARQPRGAGGFGYDPVFVVAGLGQTMAELPSKTNNTISHRARALAAIAPLLERHIG